MVLLLCYVLALHVPVFLSTMVLAEMPIEVRIISTSINSIADCRTSLQPEAQFAINRLPGEADNHSGGLAPDLSCSLQDSGVPVPASSVVISEDEKGPVTKMSFNILAVATPRDSQVQARPFLVIVAIPPDVTGELSIQYTSHKDASSYTNAEAKRWTLSDASQGAHPGAAFPTGPFASTAR